MNPELALCAHFSALARGAEAPELAHAFLWQDGAIDAIWRCRACGEPALAQLLDWAPPSFTLRVYSLAALATRDVALYLRDLERGSCDASRARDELDALCAAAGRSERLVAIDVARGRAVAAAPMPAGAAREPSAWPARLPGVHDAGWFAALRLEKRSGKTEAGVTIEVSDADLASERGAAELLDLIDAYARDPMGRSAPLDADVRARLVPDLRERTARGTAHVFVARRAGEGVGVAVCFVGYSTFRARPLLNLHDLAVLPAARGSGAGLALLDAVEARARAVGCCKVTLEVREDNARARRVYEHVGFVDYSPDASPARTLFLEKKL